MSPILRFLDSWVIGFSGRVHGTIRAQENYAICVQGIDTSHSSGCRLQSCPQRCIGSRFLVTAAMKDFANASFPPEVISVMEDALDAAVASLPEPVSSTQVQFLAEAILRAAHRGATVLM